MKCLFSSHLLNSKDLESLKMSMYSIKNITINYKYKIFFYIKSNINIF